MTVRARAARFGAFCLNGQQFEEWSRPVCHERWRCEVKVVVAEGGAVQLYPLLRRINTYLVRWARKKYGSPDFS